VNCLCSEQPVCFVSSKRKIFTAPFLNIVNRNLLNCMNYSAWKLTYVKFELFWSLWCLLSYSMVWMNIDACCKIKWCPHSSLQWRSVELFLLIIRFEF
jgi:hypothetical protein